jgi:hypothetical protein
MVTHAAGRLIVSSAPPLIELRSKSTGISGQAGWAPRKAERKLHVCIDRPSFTVIKKLLTANRSSALTYVKGNPFTLRAILHNRKLEVRSFQGLRMKLQFEARASSAAPGSRCGGQNWLFDGGAATLPYLTAVQSSLLFEQATGQFEVLLFVRVRIKQFRTIWTNTLDLGDIVRRKPRSLVQWTRVLEHVPTACFVDMESNGLPADRTLSRERIKPAPSQ